MFPNRSPKYFLDASIVQSARRRPFVLFNIVVLNFSNRTEFPSCLAKFTYLTKKVGALSQHHSVIDFTCRSFAIIAKNPAKRAIKRPIQSRLIALTFSIDRVGEKTMLVPVTTLNNTNVLAVTERDGLEAFFPRPVNCLIDSLSTQNVYIYLV